MGLDWREGPSYRSGMFSRARGAHNIHANVKSNTVWQGHITYITFDTCETYYIVQARTHTIYADTRRNTAWGKHTAYNTYDKHHIHTNTSEHITTFMQIWDIQLRMRQPREHKTTFSIQHSIQIEWVNTNAQRTHRTRCACFPIKHNKSSISWSLKFKSLSLDGGKGSPIWGLH